MISTMVSHLVVHSVQPLHKVCDANLSIGISANFALGNHFQIFILRRRWIYKEDGSGPLQPNSMNANQFVLALPPQCPIKGDCSKRSLLEHVLHCVLTV